MSASVSRRAADREYAAVAGGVAAAVGGESLRAAKLVICAGLRSDRLARLSGLRVDCRIAPFRGERSTLAPARSRIVKRLIHPAPDLEPPFLGAHLTRAIDVAAGFANSPSKRACPARLRGYRSELTHADLGAPGADVRAPNNPAHGGDAS